jgi:hypothetical protein
MKLDSLIVIFLGSFDLLEWTLSNPTVEVCRVARSGITPTGSSDII